MADRRRARAYSASPHDLKMRKNFFIQSIARARRVVRRLCRRRLCSLRDKGALASVCVSVLSCLLSPTHETATLRMSERRIHPFRTRGSSTFPPKRRVVSRPRRCRRSGHATRTTTRRRSERNETRKKCSEEGERMTDFGYFFFHAPKKSKVKSQRRFISKPWTYCRYI